MVAVPEVTALKNFLILFSRSGCSLEVSLWKSNYLKNNYYQKAPALEKELLKKVAAVKK